MSDVTIKYKGQSIATMDASGTKTLQTQGKYCEGDIEVVYDKPAGPSGTKQISIAQNGTTTEDVAAYANAEITVDVQGGGGGGTGYTLLASGSYTYTGSAAQTLSIPVTYTGTPYYGYAVADEIIASTNQSYCFVALERNMPFSQYLKAGKTGVTSAVDTTGALKTDAINSSNGIAASAFYLSRANNTYLIQPNTYNWYIYGVTT